MAAPIPPTQGPNKTAKMDGITTAGQNATPPKLRPKLVKSPITAYKAAQMPIIATSNDRISHLLHLHVLNLSSMKLA
jgi:hypothetical protein